MYRIILPVKARYRDNFEHLILRIAQLYFARAQSGISCYRVRVREGDAQLRTKSLVLLVRTLLRGNTYPVFGENDTMERTAINFYHLFILPQSMICLIIHSLVSKTVELKSEKKYIQCLLSQFSEKYDKYGISMMFSP